MIVQIGTNNSETATTYEFKISSKIAKWFLLLFWNFGIITSLRVQTKWIVIWMDTNDT